jgi:L-amino acid N-acyltransferase YncA
LPTIAEFSQRITTILTQLPWIVGELDGQIVAYAYAARHRDRAAYQWSVETSVYVHPHFQRQGTARALYEALLGLLRRQGYYNAYAGITLPNSKSDQFHRSMGFSPIGSYSNVGYKLGQWHSVQWYSLALADWSTNPTAPKPVWEVINSSPIL